MNYIYDILLNFNNEYYEFYDWNSDDKLTHIRKIPIFKISDDALKDLLYNDVTLSEDFIKLIKNKTEVFSKNYIDILNYACLLCNEKKVIAIKCNESGKVNGKSDLLIDEQSDTVSMIDRYTYYNLLYNVNNINDVNYFKTRKTVKMEKYILKELDKQSTDKLQYLLYECNNQIDSDRNVIIRKIKNSLNGEHIEEIYNFLKLATNQKKV